MSEVHLNDKLGAPIQASNPLPVSLSGGDIEIGAVEIKNGSSDQRATVDTAGNLRVSQQGTGITNTFTQLTAPGSTTGFATPGCTQHTVAVTVATINTNVVVRIEGSVDNTAWGNLDSGGLDTTITANGTYLFTCPNTLLAYLRVTFVSETGGTAATIDAKYLGQ